MNKKFVQLEFYETYYYANIVANIIEDPFSFIRGIHEWYEDNEEEVFLTTFPKISRLHEFAAHVISSLVDEQISEREANSFGNGTKNDIWIDRALKYHGLPCDGFADFLAMMGVPASEASEDNLFDYHQELRMTGEIGDLIDRLSSEVFHVLFANRKFLMQFNLFLANILQSHFDEIPDSDLGKNLCAGGILRRVTLPSWVKRAVFFRDRGMCSFCQKDLSGIISSQPDSQYDHIVPLAAGGLNDVTNIQLLCQKCNNRKSSVKIAVSNLYEAWY